VHLSVDGLPAGATASFDANDFAPPGTATLTVQTSASTPLGENALTISGADGALVHSIEVGLYVTNEAPGFGTISLDFVGSGTEMAPTEGAGVVAKPNWNELATASGTNVGLRDESGVYTGATVGWNSGGIWNLGLPNTPGDPRMMNGYLDPMAAAATITVSNLPENAGGYYVYVYADGDNASATRTGNYRLVGDDTTTTEIDITDAANTTFSGNFVLANNGVGNYAVFYTTSRGFTLTATPGASSDGTQRAPVNAIQIVRGDRIFADGFE